MNYFRLPKGKSALLAAGLALAMAAASAMLVIGPGSTTGAATKYSDFVGGGRAGISVETFRPSTIFVNAGDTVEFTNLYEEIHTVTFTAGKPAPDLVIPAPGSNPAAGPPTLIFNPQVAFPAPSQGAASYDGSAYVNSGILNKGQSFLVTFPKEGSYPFLCVVHPGMTGTVEVLAAGITVPTQAQRDFEAQAQLDQAVAQGERAAAAVQTSKTTDASGRTTWEVKTGPSVGQVDVMRFIPSRIQVNTGDTVTWTNDTPVPHTVTFLSGAPEPDLVTPQAQAAGPPNLVLNPQVLFPVRSGPGYDGTGYVNSGFIGTGPEATAGKSFSLTFTKPGTYTYICVLHEDQGMAGVVVVGAGVSPPSTGDAGLPKSAGHVTPWLYLTLPGLAATLFAFSFSVHRRRRTQS